MNTIENKKEKIDDEKPVQNDKIVDNNKDVVQAVSKIEDNTKKSGNKTVIILLSIVIISLIAIITGGYYYFATQDTGEGDKVTDEANKQKEVVTEPKVSEDVDEETDAEISEELDESFENWEPELTIDIEIDPENRKIFFIRDETYPENDEDNELWVMDWDGDNRQFTGLTGVTQIYNGPNNTWIYFRTYRDFNQEWGERLWAYNIETGVAQSILEENAEEYFVNIGQGTISISPNGKLIAYSVVFFDKASIESPEEFDPHPDRKAGFYVYDVENETKKYLGKFLLVSNWDKDSEYIYTANGEDYHEYEFADKIHRINIETGENQLVEETTAFGYTGYYFPEIGNDVIMWGDTTIGSKVIFRKGGVENVLDSGSWAEIQPYLWISSDRTKALYQNEHHYLEGVSYFSLNLINLVTGEIETIIDPDGNESFLNMFWVNNDYFVLTSKRGEYPDYMNNIIVLNVNTKERVNLTSEGNSRM